MEPHESPYMTAAELADIMQISKAYAYKIIHKLNEELSKAGYLTISGKIPRKYAEKRCYWLGDKDEGNESKKRP